MNYIINEELANKVINYLVTKPFIEVAGLIQSLQSLPKEIKKDEKETE